MKVILNNSKFLILFIVLGLAVTNCAQDFGVNADKYEKIYMPQARQNPAEHQIRLVDSTLTFTYGAAYAGPREPKNDIAVHFSVTPALVDTFNSQNLTSYPILPKDSYTLSQEMATIPAGKMGTPPLDIKLTSKGHLSADGPQNYVLPITISTQNSAIPLNDNLKTTYFVFSIFNTKIDKSLWEVIDFDSQLNDTYAAANIIDGKVEGGGTFWLTVGSFPHYAVVNMGKQSSVSGFEIVGHPAGSSPNYVLRNPKEITIQFSDDGETFSDGMDFTLPFDSQTTSARINLPSPVLAHYFKLIINKNVGSTSVMNIEEISAF